MPSRRSVISGSRTSVNSTARRAFQIEGLAEIQEKLAKIVDEVNGKKAKDVYLDAAAILRDQIKHNAPYDPKSKNPKHVRDSVFVTSGKPEKSNVLVGVAGPRTKRGVLIAHLLEYGTVNRSAHPFFRPALSQSGAKVASTIKSGLEQIIADAAK